MAGRDRRLVAACLAAVLAAASARLEPRPRVPFARPDFAYYLTATEVERETRAVASRAGWEVGVASRAEGRYAANVTVVRADLRRGAAGGGDGRGGALVAHDGDDSALRVVVNFGQHARELLTSDVGVELLRALATGADAAAERASAGGPAAVRRSRDALRNAVIWVVPIENVNGRVLVEGGKYCERKNGRGVDTNRNWEVDWGKKEKDYDPSEEFPGTRPLSEPEALALHDLVRDVQPHAWINVHTGMEALFMPFDHVSHMPTGPGASAMRRMLDEVNGLHCGGKCAVGSGGKNVGYLAHGTATDTVYEKLGVPVSFTWEIYGDQRAHYNDCFRMFNPTTRPEHDRLVRNWADAVVTVLGMLPTHPDVALPARPQDALGHVARDSAAHALLHGATVARETTGAEGAAQGSATPPPLPPPPPPPPPHVLDPGKLSIASSRAPPWAVGGIWAAALGVLAALVCRRARGETRRKGRGRTSSQPLKRAA